MIIRKILLFVMLLSVSVPGCSSSPGEAEQTYHQTTDITIENQCPKDITVLYKTIKSDSDTIPIILDIFIDAYTLEEITDEESIVHSGESKEFKVLYEERSNYRTYLYKAIEIKYCDISRAFNIDPNANIIVKTTDFN